MILQAPTREQQVQAINRRVDCRLYWAPIEVAIGAREVGVSGAAATSAKAALAVVETLANK